MEERDGIFMSKNEQFRYEMICAFQNGEMTREEVAFILETTPRNVSRLSKRVREKGMLGIKHGNTGKIPINKMPKSEKLKIQALLKAHYFDFNISHAREMLKSQHDIDAKYSTLRKICHEIELVKNKKQSRRKKHKLRVRMPNRGLLLQMDGSHHAWNGKDTWVLIAAIDDASSEIPWAEFFTSEDTLNCMTVVQRIIERVGVPEAFYVDKAGWFGGVSKRPDFSNFIRACEELGIKVIFANSPQAKGRIERVWKTMQDRLIPELRLNTIQRIPDANRYLREIFLPSYWNSKNTVVPRNPQCKYRKLCPTTDLTEILCLKDWRKIKPNQTISLEGKTYVIKDQEWFGSLKGLSLEIRTYQNLKTAYFFAGKKVEIEEIIQPLRYAPELNGTRGSANHEPKSKRSSISTKASSSDSTEQVVPLQSRQVG